ncbi:MAG: polysaccharide biosynthesis/export family protein [Terriglobia bacterium]
MRARQILLQVVAVLSVGVLILASDAAGAAQKPDSEPPSDTRVEASQEGEVDALSQDAEPTAAEEEPNPETTPAEGNKKQISNYTIGPEDVLDVDVFNVPELHKTVRVSNDGTIALALLGHVKAAGLTTEQLRNELENKYGETYLQNPQISVFVSEFHAQPVSVIGAVEKPGLYQLTGPRTLIEVLSMAGGLAKRTSGLAGKYVYVTRKGGFGDLPMSEGMQLVAPDRLEIIISRLLYSRENALNIQIQPRDTISVTKADVVYVVGDVRKPGGFVMEDRENITVLQALAMAEGALSTAAKNRARIIRKGPDGERSEIPVDLDKVLSGKSSDEVLMANDILFVPNSAAKTALKRGAETTIGTISGILIYRR